MIFDLFKGDLARVQPKSGDEQQGKGKNETDIGAAPASVNDVPLLEDQDVEETELDFEGDNFKPGTLYERDLKSPIVIKVTDPETQAFIEGAVDLEETPGMGRNTRFKSFSGMTRASADAQRGRSETMPAGVATAQGGQPWSSKAERSGNETDFPSISNPGPDSLPRNTPGELDLSATRKIEKSESIYTPLLNKTREPLTGGQPYVGTNKFETEMALSSSLARETVARESQQGMYASLISVSNRDNESRKGLLLQPLYVVSVGSGYMDLRRKQKVGSGLDFFMRLTAGEPSPKLLIWKVTSWLLLSSGIRIFDF